MANNPNAAANLTPVVAGQVLNPNGRPKGSKSISTWIRMLMEDENFETNLLDSKRGLIEYKGAPIKALIHVAIHRAIHDDKNGHKWADWLGKYGYGIAIKLEEEHKVEVVHIYKPEKATLEDFNQQGEILRLKAREAVEVMETEMSDLEGTSRSTNNGASSAGLGQ